MQRDSDTELLCTKTSALSVYCIPKKLGNRNWKKNGVHYTFNKPGHTEERNLTSACHVVAIFSEPMLETDVN